MTHWDDIERLVHDRIDGIASAADEAKLDAILASDPELARRARELTDVVAGLRSLDREQAPADFTRRVMDRVESARGGAARRWSWRMAGPALMAAAAIVVAALWIGRSDLTPPTLEAQAPVGSRDVWSEPPAAPASKAKPMPGAAIESKREEAPERFDDDIATLGFVGRPKGESADPDPVLDALSAALRDHARVLELDDVSKEDADEATNDAVPPVPAERDDDRARADADGEDAGAAVRVILLRRSAVERKQKSVDKSPTAGGAPRGPFDGFDGLLPADQSTGGHGRKAKYRAPKNASDPAGSDALSALATTHAERLRDVELDDAELATLLRVASERGYDAFELDPASIGTSAAPAPSAAPVAEAAEEAGSEKDATDTKGQNKAADDFAGQAVRRGEVPLRWLPLPSPTDAGADTREASAETAMKKAVRELPRRRTIVVLAAD